MSRRASFVVLEVLADELSVNFNQGWLCYHDRFLLQERWWISRSSLWRSDHDTFLARQGAIFFHRRRILSKVALGSSCTAFWWRPRTAACSDQPTYSGVVSSASWKRHFRGSCRLGVFFQHSSYHPICFRVEVVVFVSVCTLSPISFCLLSPVCLFRCSVIWQEFSNSLLVVSVTFFKQDLWSVAKGTRITSLCR